MKSTTEQVGADGFLEQIFVSGGIFTWIVSAVGIAFAPSEMFV